MPRRPNGEGTIRQRKDGHWEASASLNGRRYWLTGKSQTEVRRRLNDLRQQQAVGTLVAPNRLTLGAFLDQWLEAGRADWKPKTHHGYAAIGRNYWQPALGHVAIQKLTPAMIATNLTAWREGRTGGTMLNVYRCLHRALMLAVQWGLIGRNPADAVAPPKAKRKRPDLWTLEQAGCFLRGTEGDPWHVLWALLLGTGCRLGEALAFRWSDLDEAGMTIRRSVGWIHGQRIEGEPKTAAGRRSLVLPTFTLDALAAWRHEQLTARLELGPEWRGDDYVVTLTNGTIPTPWHVRGAFERACAAAGLPRLRRHDLRHLSASILLARGQPLPEVAARLGHSSPAITASIYAHALKGHDQAAASALDAALSI